MPAAKNVSKKKVASPSETDYLQRVEEDMRALKNTAASLQTTINLLQDDIRMKLVLLRRPWPTM